MARVVVDPITRIEGHLKIEAEVTNGVISDAWSSGTMARGIEKMLTGRDPRDATYVTERLCGVCFGSHGWASAIAVEKAQGTKKLPELARLLRNLILGACWLHDKPLHFYHLSALDYLDLAVLTNYQGTDPNLLQIKELLRTNQAGPLLPRYTPDEYCVKDLDLVAHCVQSYLTALKMQAVAKKMAAIFCGKQPHQSSIVPGGVTQLPNAEQRGAFKSLLDQVANFIKNVYVADVVLLGTGPLLGLAKSDVGVGYQNFLCYGGFPEDDTGENFLLPAGAIVNGSLVETSPAAIEQKITEAVTYSWYLDTDGGHPYNEGQNFTLDKPDAYSFLKAPRYDGNPMEVGPLARLMVAIARQNSHSAVKTLTDLVAQGVKPGAVARHAARALEALMIVDGMYRWLDKLESRIAQGDRTIHDTAHWEPPASGRGYGLVEAPRGSLGHWAIISQKVLANYSMVVSTTWNASPRDAAGQVGPIEKALIGCPVPDLNNPINIVRVVRSFDPCIACAVHLIHPTSNRVVRIELNGSTAL
ncbi:MAG: nickel-dependent hydrogenase large subunit [Bacillota bacterium]|jgi:hydrogenase large subunit|nr:nickel-dependent hydrogenase large subunit [Thermoanaerobacteraceae bacterium]